METFSGDRSVISEIMQRFRPIAPKPVAGGCLDDTDVKASGDTKSSLGRNRRSKRKYVRVRNKNNKHNYSNCNTDGEKRKITSAPTSDLDHQDTVGEGSGSQKDIVTLQLLPEKEKDLRARESVFEFTDSVSTSEYCTESNSFRGPLPGGYRTVVGVSPSDRTVVVESWVTVERVTGTCTDEEIIRNLLRGRTDAERVRCLEVDTCPGFVSDGSNRVGWVNGSYRRMMGLNGGEEVRVWVVVTVEQMEEMEIACMGGLCGAVTCRVRVQHESTWREEKLRSAVKMTMPCDVWRLCSGGFAWRLDVEAALCLGR